MDFEEEFDPVESEIGEETTPGLVPRVDVANEREFLDALALRLNEIVRRPIARYVVSFVAGQPNSRPRPIVR